MTLNGVMALFCVISANSGSFQGAVRKSSRSLSHLLMSSCLFLSWKCYKILAWLLLNSSMKLYVVCFVWPASCYTLIPNSNSVDDLEWLEGDFNLAAGNSSMASFFICLYVMYVTGCFETFIYNFRTKSTFLIWLIVQMQLTAYVLMFMTVK